MTSIWPNCKGCKAASSIHTTLFRHFALGLDTCWLHFSQTSQQKGEKHSLNCGNDRCYELEEEHQVAACQSTQHISHQPITHPWKCWKKLSCEGILACPLKLSSMGLMLIPLPMHDDANMQTVGHRSRPAVSPSKLTVLATLAPELHRRVLVMQSILQTISSNQRQGKGQALCETY